MKFIEFIKENRSGLVDEWFKWLISHYPEPSRVYISKKEEAFTNPVGYSLYQNVGKILDGLSIGDAESKEFQESIKEIIKIRSIQGLELWLAVNIFEFLWREYLKDSDSSLNREDLLSSMDFYHRLLSICISKFVEIKETIAEIQKNEIRNRYGKILERLNERYSLLNDDNNEKT